MPLKDKKRLDFFFRDVCFMDAWAYTLLGSKPMSIHQYTKPWVAFRNWIKHPDLRDILFECFCPPDVREIRYLFTPEQLKIKWGWDTLNKYICYFPSSRFALCEYSNDNEIVILMLVDKVKLVETVKRYLGDFQGVLRSQAIEPEALFDEEKLYLFLKSLNHNGLIGTVLGFGRENAWFFHKYQQMDPQERPMVSMWKEEEGANLEALNQKTLSFQPWDLSDLFYPRFACDPQSEETRQLKKTYREEREKIIRYYEGRDVVEVTLSLFNNKKTSFSK